MLSRMLLNHIYDQSGSLKSANDHWSHKQSSQWACKWCACGHVPYRPRRGGYYANVNRVLGDFER